MRFDKRFLGRRAEGVSPVPGENLTVPEGLFADLLAGGEATLLRWQREQREESVHLECKSATPSQQPGMTKADVVQLAAVVSAFANSEGGVLVFGVDARRADGRDCIQNLVPINDIAAFHRSAEAVRADLVAPAHAGLEMLPIPSATAEGAGYLAVRVDQSERRPHRSMKDHIYYRRSHDRTSPMEHSDLKDAMSRARGPELEIAVELLDILPDDHRPVASAASFTILVALVVKNVGAAMARYPFLHLEISPGGNLYDPTMDRRRVPAWPRMLSEAKGHRLQGGADNVIPIGTDLRVAFAYWTYKPDTATVAGTPVGAAFLGVAGKFGCEGCQTRSFATTIDAPVVVSELHRRGVPIRSTTR
jgi:hypothetical protein